LVLAQAHFEKQEEQGATQAGHRQSDDQHLTGQSANQDPAHHASDDKQGRRSERRHS
jgi:hypothetical protein